ncbi:MAG: Uma2 family endonuclease [Nitrospira sp.]|nr:Uma2 family endonuclease [Nitrospira sp.]
MATQTGHLRLTYEDYRLIPDDGKRHELIDGEHVISPSPSIKHQRISLRLSHALHRFLQEHRLGEIFVAPCDVVLSDFDVVQPDLIFVATAQAAIVTEANIRGIPTLVVEILSEGNRKLDETIKRQQYEHYGIPEYWIIDPELEQIKIYRLTDGRYGQASVLSLEAQEQLATPLLPTLSLPLATLFK